MDYMQLLHQWLVDFADDMETIADLESIEDDPKEAEDRFYRELEFGTAGMRGVLGAGTNRLNIYNVRRVTRALAKYILTTPDGAQRGVVDVRGLDPVEHIGVAPLLRVHGHAFQAGVIDFVGPEAQQGRSHEGFAVVGDGVAELAGGVLEGHLEPGVGAGQDRQQRQENG